MHAVSERSVDSIAKEELADCLVTTAMITFYNSGKVLDYKIINDLKRAVRIFPGVYAKPALYFLVSKGKKYEVIEHEFRPRDVARFNKIISNIAGSTKDYR